MYLYSVAFRPFKGEVLDAVVTQVTKFGFFAEAGPLSIFVSNQLISDDMTFESVGENAYVSADQEVRTVTLSVCSGCTRHTTASHDEYNCCRYTATTNITVCRCTTDSHH